ncbi:hypothetical protein HanOQP8_Chr06g0209261 [Helianthus annuus]|nr:hypothetical protein HanOQP8_Chr06g0209261 [Helianthus annuus]
MERALNGTKMGDSKLIVNLARYAKENEGVVGGANKVKTNFVKDKQVHLQDHVIRKQSFINKGKGKLFCDLFKEGVGSSELQGQSAKETEIIIDIADNTSAFKEFIGCTVVGRCKDLKILRNLDVLLSEVRVGGVSLKYLGGLSMVLKFDDEEVCSKFLLDFHLWKDWFSNLDPWDGQPLPFERLAWVKVHGVPLQLADNDVLNNITEHFGKIVHGSQLEAEDVNLSVSCIGLLVRDGGRVNGQVSLRWQKKLFRVWVVEEYSEWFPDSVGRVDSPVSHQVNIAVNLQSDGDPASCPPEVLRPVGEAEKVGLEGVEGSQRAARDVHGEGENAIMKDLRNVPYSQGSQEPPFLSHRDNLSSGSVHISRSQDILFFKVGSSSRPSNKKIRLRSNLNKPNNRGARSPQSGERPKKRLRDNGDFLFDLNRHANSTGSGVPLEDPFICSQEDRENNRERESGSVNPDLLLSPGEEAREVGQIVCPVEEVLDSPVQQIEEEVLATINIGKVVGVDL